MLGPEPSNQPSSRPDWAGSESMDYRQMSCTCDQVPISQEDFVQAAEPRRQTWPGQAVQFGERIRAKARPAEDAG